MSLFGMRRAATAVRLAKVAACALTGALALAPLSALADEPTVDEPQVEAVVEEAPAREGATSDEAIAEVPEAADSGTGETATDATADGGGLEAEPLATGPDVVTLKLAQGTRDYARAQAVVDAVNRLRTGAEEPAEPVAVDAKLQQSALQRAAETAVWQSAERPAGGRVANATELRFHGSGAEPSAVVDALAAAGGQLAGADLRSIGVGCWEQGGERFYVVLLGTGEPDAAGAVTTGTDAWAPEVQVDLSGRTSPVLQGRLQASGYRTNLPMVPGSTRAVRLSWVTAPEESDLAVAKDLPSITIDPSSFQWTSSDQAAATVSPAGVVTMRGTSILTPVSSRESGADITARLEGTDRALTFHVSAAVPVYRLYNAGNGAHLYTTDLNEYRTLPGYGWTPEPVAWQGVWSSNHDGEFTGTPVYRLLNPSNGDHHYTVDANEYRTLPNYGWRQEGIAYYSADGLEGQPVYRVYNSFQTAEGGLGSHLWTTDGNEYATLGSMGWTQEGTGLYGVRP